MSTILPRRDMLDRFLDAAAAYREAYAAVEKAIDAEKNADLPSWIFNLERVAIEDLRALAPAVARAEAHRRAARSALHATAELLAHDDPGSELATQPAVGSEPIALAGAIRSADASAVGDLAASLEARQGDDRYWLRVLDRFVGIVNRADDGGCLYLDGRFVPLETHEGEDEGTGVTQITRPPLGTAAADPLRRDEG